MAGFRWSPRTLPANPAPGSNGWCVRDSYCQLLQWPPGSAEWSRFIEYPHQDDLLPLAGRLGVTVYDVGIAQHWNEPIGKLDHPGIAMFDIPAAATGHAVYVHHVHALLHRWPNFGGHPRTDLPTSGWPLGPEHLQYNLVIKRVAYSGCGFGAAEGSSPAGPRLPVPQAKIAAVVGRG